MHLVNIGMTDYMIYLFIQNIWYIMENKIL